MPFLVGRTREPPFVAGVQLVDRRAPVLDQRNRRHVDAVDSAGFPRLPAGDDSGAAGIQSLLSILDSYRDRAAHAAVVRVLFQYAVAPPGASWVQSPLPRSQLRRRTHGVGSFVR